MAKFNQDLHQFGSAKPANAGGSQDCAQCEAMLADALDGTLSAEDRARFDLHMAGCTSCSEMLADAQRGAAWLELLRTPRPEPPAALLERILAQTSSQTSSLASVLDPGNLSIPPVPSAAGRAPGSSVTSILNVRPATVLPFRIPAALRSKSLGRAMLQPRLAMTAAMAFFSIALTLNLTGVRLNELRASDLKPSSIRRSFYQANAHVVRYYDSLRVVYELESRVRDLQRSNDNDAPAPSEPADRKPADGAVATPKSGEPKQKQARPRPNSGTSRRQGPTEIYDRPSLAAFNRFDAPASPPWHPGHLASASVSTSNTLQEGESV